MYAKVCPFHVAAFFVFALGYNAVCTDCVTYDPPFWVMQHAMGTPQFWLVTLLSAVAAILPRYYTILQSIVNNREGASSQILGGQIGKETLPVGQINVTPCEGNTILFCSCQQLLRLCVGPLKGF